MKILRETQTQLILKQTSFQAIIWGLFSAAIGGSILLFISHNHNQNTLIVILFGLAFALAGIWMIVTAKFITITIDKTQNQFTFQAASILGKKQQSLALNQIKEVVIEEYISRNPNSAGPRNQLNFTLVFYLQDGEGIPIPLNASGTTVSFNGIPFGGFFFGRNKNIIMGNKIASFIGVPFVDRRPPTVGEIVQDVTQEINAKKMMQETPPLQGVPPASQPPQQLKQ
jgi:hypothetical protein